MTSTYQLELTLPGAEPRGQLDIFTALPAYVDGEPARWSKPARDLTTWTGMADELAERLADFAEMTTMAQGLVIGHALGATAGTMTLGEYLEAAARRAATSDLTEGTPRYARRFAHMIARDALELTEAFGLDK